MSSRKRPLAAGVAQDPRWNAVQARDAAADGTFVYSVETTGVYCRPTCGARRPRPGNVAFHPSAAAAERAGFRPCKRCKPDLPPPAERQAAQVAALCRFIEGSDGVPTLDELARHAGFSPFHTHRVFKAVTGVTPRAYANAHRAARVRATLRDEGSVTGALYRAGYRSPAPFYGKANELLGMTPSRYRAGGVGLTIRFTTEVCSLGSVLVATTERGVCAILLGDDPQAMARDLSSRFPRAQLLGADGELGPLVARVVALVDGTGADDGLPLDIRGTAFQHRVWQALRRVPAGETVTYSDLARSIGAPRAARAVAGACADNPLAVAVPCHRVVRADGGLAGYRWGLERKRALLAREAEPTEGES